METNEPIVLAESWFTVPPMEPNTFRHNIILFPGHQCLPWWMP